MAAEILVRKKSSESRESWVQLRFLFLFIGQHRKWIALSAILGAGTAGMQVALSKYVKVFIDYLSSTDPVLRNIVLLGATLPALVLFDGIFDFSHRYFLRLTVERTVRDLRLKIFQRLLIFSESSGAPLQSGKAITHVISDVSSFGVGIVHLMDLIKEPLVILFLVGWMFTISWKLTLFTFIAIGVLPLIGGKLARSARRNHSRYQESIEGISAHTIETVRGRRTALAFGRQKEILQEFAEKNNRAYGFQLRLSRTEEIVSPATKWITSVVGAVIVGYAGFLVLRNEMSIGDLTSFVLSAGGLQGPLKLLNQSNVRMQQFIATGSRLKRFLDTPLDDIGRAQEKALHEETLMAPKSRSLLPLEFVDVDFAYPNRESGDSRLRPALKNIFLRLDPAKKIALVGRSGSGKTTLSLLALRLLDPQKGQVLLGGRPASQWPLQEYRAHFSYVSQDVFLFDKSVRENFLFAKAGATDAEIWTALDKAAIGEFARGLAQGLDTQIGELGSSLSGGERQRLALARAFLRDSPIIILDEATSQLDAHAEAIVQTTMRELMKNRSVLLIAHRLSTVREADEILVFEKGEVIERGTPVELLGQKDGHFHSLWKTQFDSISGSI